MPTWCCLGGFKQSPTFEVNISVAKAKKQADLTLLWPSNELAMTLWYLSNEARPQPISPCVLWMGFNRYNLPFVKHTISVLYWIYFYHIRQGWHKGDLMGYKPSNSLITLLPFGAFLDIGPCWGLGMLQAIIDISKDHNFSKINKNKLFSLVLSWFDLAVTLRWPYHDLGVTPLWSPTPRV